MTKKVTKKHNNLKLTKVSGGKSGVMDTITDLGKKGIEMLKGGGAKAPAAPVEASNKTMLLNNEQIMALKSKPGFWD